MNVYINVDILPCVQLLYVYTSKSKKETRIGDIIVKDVYQKKKLIKKISKQNEYRKKLIWRKKKKRVKKKKKKTKKKIKERKINYIKKNSTGSNKSEIHTASNFIGTIITVLISITMLLRRNAHETNALKVGVFAGWRRGGAGIMRGRVCIS